MIRCISADLENSSDDSDEEYFKSLSCFLINSSLPKISINSRVAAL